MPGNWKQLPLLKVIAVVAIILIACSFFIKSKPGVKQPPSRIYGITLQEAVGYGAAVEVAAALNQKGKVALVLPGKSGDTTLEPMMAEPFMRGFKKGLEKFTGLELLGYYLNYSQPRMSDIQQVMTQYTQTDSIVVFTGLPQIYRMNNGEKLPKIVAFFQGPNPPSEKPNLVEAVIIWKAGTPFPGSHPEGTHEEVFAKYYVALK